MEYAEQFQELEKTIQARHPGVDLSLLRKAYHLADDMHKEQKRELNHL